MIGYELPSRAVEYEERSKLAPVDPATLRVGDLVVIRSRGDHRLARVTRIGRTRIGTEYTTASALANAAAWGTPAVVTRKSVSLDDNWLKFYAKREQRLGVV